jgi:hypothetical protein
VSLRAAEGGVAILNAGAITSVIIDRFPCIKYGPAMTGKEGPQ